jgi:hypothetical protein
MTREENEFKPADSSKDSTATRSLRRGCTIPVRELQAMCVGRWSIDSFGR